MGSVSEGNRSGDKQCFANRSAMQRSTSPYPLDVLDRLGAGDLSHIKVYRITQRRYYYNRSNLFVK